LTFTFGYFLLKALITSWNCFWPDVDVQMPSKLIVPLILAFEAVVLSVPATPFS